MKKRRARDGNANPTASDFYVEAEYADSIFRTALGDREGALSRLKRALELKPTYAPAILSMGSVEYQRGRRAEGRRLFRSLLSLPEDTPDLCEIIDEAGSFLIQIGAYADGLALLRGAIERFPAVAALQQGFACCAGHEGCHDEAVAASERALQLEPENQKFVNDLGWSLLEAGRLEEAEKVLDASGLYGSVRRIGEREPSHLEGKVGTAAEEDALRTGCLRRPPRAGQALAETDSRGRAEPCPCPSRPLGRRSGCFPAVPYPPPRPSSV